MLDLNLDLSNTQVHAPEPTVSRPRELLTPIPGLPDEYLLVLDNSAAEKWMMCPTMAKNYLVEGREAHARNAALTFGGCVHEGLERLLRGPASEHPDFSDHLINVAADMQKFWNDNPSPPDEYRTLNNAIEVIVRYAERAKLPDYDWSILQDNKGLLIERAFELPLGVLDVGTTIQLPNWEAPRQVDRIHVAWSGRIDLIANAHGRVRVVDHKTTSIAGDNFIQDFQLSNQTQGYVWAAQQIWPELDVSGFCVNAIHLKKPASGCGISERGPRGGPPALQFFRAYFDYSPERLSEWTENALTLVEDFVHCLVRDYFPLHTKQCFNKYGRCSYHDVCTIDNKEVRLKFLRSDAFKSVTWNPTNGR